jgi:dolichyl-phosphate-mannose--protein O-mannosyl transferase
MDGILFFFMFATILAILKSKDKSILLGMSTLLGLTVSIKWVGLAIIVPLCYLSLRRKKFGEFLLGIWWAALVYLVVVGFGQWLSHAPDVLEGIAQWNREAWDYHRALTDTHPWSSPWWGWPLLTRPVLFIYDAAGDQAAQVMTTLGNPLVWWASGLAVIGSIGHLIRERFVRKVSIVDHPLVLPLLGWAACFLPWALVHRVVFLYHYMPAYGFALLCLAYWLARWFRKDPWLVVAICVVFVIVTLYFIPFMVGWWPLSLVAIKQHLWLTSWLY